ncbi:MAG: hypothetical protein COB30_012205 [Ectothiorhodospiraceae bacterium]|nr:hypothetical protein [Ectothiorhodospiraceae bacterium]
MSSMAFAECSVDLPFDQLMDRMVEEGAAEEDVSGEYPMEQSMDEVNQQPVEGKQSV